MLIKIDRYIIQYIIAFFCKMSAIVENGSIAGERDIDDNELFVHSVFSLCLLTLPVHQNNPISNIPTSPAAGKKLVIQKNKHVQNDQCFQVRVVLQIYETGFVGYLCVFSLTRMTDYQEFSEFHDCEADC